MAAAASMFAMKQKAAMLAVAAGVMLAGSGLAGSGPALAQGSRAAPGMEWDYDWVVLTVARNGAWGAATHQSLMRAMIQAINECRRRSGPDGSGDCGGEITTVRDAWSLAYACGDYTFIANGSTSADARLAAIDRAVDLKEILGLELAPCTLLVAVGNDGRVEPTGPRRELLSIPQGR